MREDGADARVLALPGLLLSEGSSDETHKDNDGILELTTPEADPVDELAMPEGLSHKAGWTFVSTCHSAFSVSIHIENVFIDLMHACFSGSHCLYLHWCFRAPACGS